MGSLSGYGKTPDEFTIDSLKTASKTIPGAINELFGMVEDSGWIEPQLGTNFKKYSDLASDRTSYRKKGNQVTIYGKVYPNATIRGSTTEYTIFTLPEGYRPSRDIMRVCQGSGSMIWLLRVKTNGIVSFSKCRNTGVSGYVDVTETSFLLFTETFFVD